MWQYEGFHHNRQGRWEIEAPKPDAHDKGNYRSKDEATAQGPSFL